METTEESANSATIIQLSKGLLEVYEPPFTTIRTHIKELIDKQEGVLSKMTAERMGLDDLQNDAELDALIANIATSKARLSTISNSMMELHKKMQLLRARTEIIERVAQQKMADPHTGG